LELSGLNNAVKEVVVRNQEVDLLMAEYPSNELVGYTSEPSGLGVLMKFSMNAGSFFLQLRTKKRLINKLYCRKEKLKKYGTGFGFMFMLVFMSRT
jgi:hypothetical protein